MKLITKKFPLFNYALDLAKKGGSHLCVLNAANEVSVQRFLNREIRFVDIFDDIRRQVESFEHIENPDIDDIINIHHQIHHSGGTVRVP